ncbi:MAG: protein kinase domain-containing protein, partial [Planctomycetota bacterium]
VRARVAMMIEVCEAVHHGHTHGVIHRDLKPANILVDGAGRVRVIDFGIARITDADVTRSQVTEAGQSPGTRAYMAPEQFSGDALAIDARCDVYALGVVLYELLCGALPYRISTSFEAARIIAEMEPRRPSLEAPSLRGDLETIILTALGKTAEERYASAAHLADDLRRFLRHEPIAASPPSPIRRIAKFARRRTAVFVAITAVTAGLLLAVAGTSWGLVRAARTAERLRLQVYVGDTKLALSGIESGHLPTAAAALAGAAMQGDQVGWEYHYLAGLLQQSLGSIERGDGFERVVAASPTDPWFVAIRGRSVLLLDAQDLSRQVSEITLGMPIVKLAYSPGGRQIAVVCRDPQTEEDAHPLLISVGLDGTMTEGLRISSGTHGPLAWSPDGALLAVSHTDGRVNLVDASTLAHDRRIGALGGQIVSTAFSPDGRHLATAAADGTVRLHDLSAEDAGPVELQGYTGDDIALAFSHDGELLATSGGDAGVVRVHRVAHGSGRGRDQVLPVEDVVMSLAFVPNSRLLVIGGESGAVRIWRVWYRREEWRGSGSQPGWSIEDVESTARIGELLAHADGVTSIAVATTGRVVTHARHGTSHRWAIGDVGPMPALRGHRSTVQGVAFLDDATIVSGSGDGTVRVWDIETCQPIDILCDAPDEILDVLVTPTGRIVAGDHCGTMTCWTPGADGMMELTDQYTLEVRINALVLSPDERTIFAGCDDGHAYAVSFDPESGRFVDHTSCADAGSRIGALALVPGEGLLACGTAPVGMTAGTLQFVDVRTFDRVFECATPYGVHALAVDDDGDRLAVGIGAAEATDALIWLLSVPSGRIERELTGHAGIIYDVAFGSGRLFSVAGDSTFQVWDPDAGAQVLVQKRFAPATDIAISPDGTRIGLASRGSSGAGNTVELLETWPDPGVHGAFLESRADESRRRRVVGDEVRRLLRDHADVVSLIRAIESSTAIPDEARSTAVTLGRYLAKNIHRQADLAWDVAIDTDATPDQVQRAADRARAMIRATPVDHDRAGALYAIAAVAACRAGRHEEALAAAETALGTLGGRQGVALKPLHRLTMLLPIRVLCSGRPGAADRSFEEAVVDLATALEDAAQQPRLEDAPFMAAALGRAWMCAFALPVASEPGPREPAAEAD